MNELLIAFTNKKTLKFNRYFTKNGILYYHNKLKYIEFAYYDNNILRVELNLLNYKNVMVICKFFDNIEFVYSLNKRIHNLIDYDFHYESLYNTLRFIENENIIQQFYAKNINIINHICKYICKYQLYDMFEIIREDIIDNYLLGVKYSYKKSFYGTKVNRITDEIIKKDLMNMKSYIMNVKINNILEIL